MVMQKKNGVNFILRASLEILGLSEIIKFWNWKPCKYKTVLKLIVWCDVEVSWYLPGSMSYYMLHFALFIGVD